MKRERAPKGAWVGWSVGNDSGIAFAKNPPRKDFVRYVLPSRSTVESRLRDAVVRAAMGTLCCSPTCSQASGCSRCHALRVSIVALDNFMHKKRGGGK